MHYSEKIIELFSAQLNEWDLAKRNYSQLSNVKTRILDYATFRIIVQFNPERMRSTAANVDARSIESRPCFLCSSNRPSVQKEVKFEQNLTILVNPFPIFPRHLTVPSEYHTDQRILQNFEKMLLLAQAIPDFVVFYNGPQCGASAPDHFHLQAGNKGFLPVEADFIKGTHVRLLRVKNGIELWNWNDYLRGIITIRGNVKEEIVRIFNCLYQKFSSLQNDKPEPMLNILASHNDNVWTIHIIPRKVHRPKQFFLGDDEKILLSPASVDLGGVIITPREEDFLKITIDDVADIFGQVCMDENELLCLLSDI
jgi:ATP adenylyltransferase/5',5'''-P-1,P-4-tetraphosphate phosphorylase II